MLGIHSSVTNRVIAITALTLGLGLPVVAAGQAAAPAPDAAASDAPQVDAVKTDAATTDAPKADAAKPDAAAAEAVKPGEPTDPKARKTYASAIDWERHGHDDAALDDFRKANKQDGGHCWDCLRRAYGLATRLDAYKDAVEIARDWLGAAQSDKQKGEVEFHLAMALQEQGIKEKKDKCIAESADDFKAALELDPKLVARAHYHYGVTLARLHQDDAARAEFTAFLDQDRRNPTLHPRAERFIDHIELARATMAPPFALTTLDGQHITMDSLAGKVVLIDFWATWCGPCRDALPHMRYIAKRFDGQPFVMLSISQDNDEAAWMQFVGKNGMTWMQARDAGANGGISKKFGVTAIPATFSIDADGVLEDQHVGDAEIEGKLKKLIARAVEMGNRPPEPAVADKAPDGAK
jgi:thiol-disulfide isomerase/thioredoxin